MCGFPALVGTPVLQAAFVPLLLFTIHYVDTWDGKSLFKKKTRNSQVSLRKPHGRPTFHRDLYPVKNDMEPIYSFVVDAKN
jgi:hypothetical protein